MKAFWNVFGRFLERSSDVAGKSVLANYIAFVSNCLTFCKHMHLQKHV